MSGSVVSTGFAFFPMSRSVKLIRLVGKTGDLSYQMGGLHFTDTSPSRGWVPLLNAYRYEDRYEICVDLAGVPKPDIEVEVSPGRLRISGQRHVPEDGRCDSGCCQVLALEIENGRFWRELALSSAVDPEKVSARQENGLLWIVLPLKDLP